MCWLLFSHLPFSVYHLHLFVLFLFFFSAQNSQFSQTTYIPYIKSAGSFAFSFFKYPHTLPFFFHIFFCMFFSCYIIPFVVIVVSLFLFLLFFVFFCKWSEREQSRFVTSTMIVACGVELFIFYVWGTLLYTTLWWLVGFIPYFVVCFVV